VETGATARFVVAKSSNGRLQALNLIGTYFENNDPGGSALVSGTVDSVDDNGIVVNGISIPWASFAPSKNFKAGDHVQVSVDTTEDGAVATEVKPSVTGTTTATAQVFTLEGTIEGDVTRSTSSWTISNLEFEITDSTIVDASGGIAEDGARVQVEGVSVVGELRANTITILAREAPSAEITVIGSFAGYDGDSWVIGGLPVVAPSNSTEDPATNSVVTVNARRQGDEFFVNDFYVVETPDDTGFIRLQGTIKNIDGVAWTMEFGQIRVDSTAEVIGGEPGVGQRALIWGEQGVNGRLEAVFVRILDAESILSAAVDLLATPSP
jgi:hypothetical protein